MFKDRSKIFFFTVIVECFVAVLFLVGSSMSGMNNDIQNTLTVGSFFLYTGIQTIGILLVVSAVLDLVGLVYKNKELITLGTVLVIVSLACDFFGTTLLITFQNVCDESVLFATVIDLLLLLIMIVIKMIGFEDQLKTLKKNEKKSK